MDVIGYALTIVQIVVGAVVTMSLAFYFSRRLRPFDRLGQVLEKIFIDDKSVENVTEATESLVQIGTAAESINKIFQNEELLNGLLTQIAQRGVKIYANTLAGVASGDSRRMAKAEGIVNEAMVKGLKKLHPLIDYGLRITELDKVIEEEPEMFQYIMAQLMDKGFLNMINPESLAVPRETGERTQFDFRMK